MKSRVTVKPRVVGEKSVFAVVVGDYLIVTLALKPSGYNFDNPAPTRAKTYTLSKNITTRGGTIDAKYQFDAKKSVSRLSSKTVLKQRHPRH